jgi:hypothetical protein
MNRLIRKSWYTITEAAAYLTQNTNGQVPVSVSDLLQLSAEGKATITLRLFSKATVTHGDLVLLARQEDLARDIEGPPNTTIRFCADEEYQGLCDAGEIVELGPPALVFETCRPNADIKNEIEFIPVGPGKEIMRSWWLASLHDNTANLDRLAKLTGSVDGNLCERPIFFSVPDPENTRVAKTTLSALPDDTFLGITSANLDSLLAGNSGTPAEARGNQHLRANEQLPEDLDLLITAWRAFWKNSSQRDRSSWPKKEHVERWLTDKGLSSKNADAGATMISPDWARKGGRR